MKNVFLIMMVLVIGFVSKAQTPFSTPNLLTGGATKITQNKGAAQFDSGLLVKPRFTDTASANLSVVSLYGGMLIRVLDTLWMRNESATRWNKMGGSAGSAGSYVDGIYRTPGIDSIYFTISGTTYAIKDSTDEDACDVIVDVLADIPELEDYSGNALTVIVTDSLRGGVFNYYASGLTADNGIVFSATGKGSGYWKRDFQGASGVNVFWYGAKGDSTNNDTQPIQNALNSGYGIYLPKGVYIIDTTLDFKADGQFIYGDSSLLKLETTKNVDVLHALEFDDIKIIDIKIDGGKNYPGKVLAVSKGRGIDIIKCNNVLIENVEVYNCWEHGIRIAHQDVVPTNPETTIYNNISIINCKSHDNGNTTYDRGAGIWCFMGLKNVRVDRCEVLDNVFRGIFFDDGEDGVRGKNWLETENISVTNCYVRGNGEYSTQQAIMFEGVNNFTCSNNNVDGNHYDAIVVNDGQQGREVGNGTIFGNTVKAYQNGVRIVDVVNVNISSNIITLDTSLQGNFLSSNKAAGVNIYKTSDTPSYKVKNISLSNNSIYSNSCGVLLEPPATNNTETPSSFSGTASGSGGSILAGTYYYKVSAIATTGESPISSELTFTTTGSTSSVSFTWDAVSGATSYRVWVGEKSDNQNEYFTVATNSAIDSGQNKTSGTPIISTLINIADNDIYFTGAIDTTTTNYGIRHVSGDKVTIKGNKIYGFYNGILNSSSAQPTGIIQDNSVYNSSDYGIILNTVCRVIGNTTANNGLVNTTAGGFRIQNNAINSATLLYGNTANDILTIKQSASGATLAWNNFDNFQKVNGLRVASQETTTTVNIGSNDFITYANATSGNVTINFPDATSVNNGIGTLYIVKKIDSTTNKVFINTSGSQTVDGIIDDTLYYKNQSVLFANNGTGWYKIASYIGTNDIDLTKSYIKNTLPITNGGTGLSSISADKILYSSATNTLSTADFKSVSETAYTGSISWTGTTPPSGSTNHTYRWQRIGNVVNLQINLVYGVAGTALTEVIMELPSDCPLPDNPDGLSSANNFNSFQRGNMSSSATTQTTSSTSCTLQINSGGTGYQIHLVSSGTSARYVWASITYFTN